MPKNFSGKQLVQFLSKKGFSIYSQKGSHVKMISISRNTKTIVPLHKVVAIGTLKDIIRQSKLSGEEKGEFFDS